ncbi:MAG: hypothetical protein U0703_16040 [Anaerolineae bacterium]
MYDFTLFIDGNAADSKRLLIGQAAQSAAELQRSGVQDPGFAGQRARQRRLADRERRQRPVHLPEHGGWHALDGGLYYQGSEVRRDRQAWSDGNSGAKTISVQDPNGLLPGGYRLELYVQDQGSTRLAATSDFTLAGAQEGAYARIFANAHFTTATSDAEDSPVRADHRGITAGVASTLCSTGANRAGDTVDDALVGGRRRVLRADPAWSAAESGDNFLIRLERGRRPRRHVQDGAVRRQGVVHVDRGARRHRSATD